MNARHVQLNLNAGERDSLRHPHPNPNGRLINFTQNHVHLEKKRMKQRQKETLMHLHSHRVVVGHASFHDKMQIPWIKTSLVSFSFTLESSHFFFILPSIFSYTLSFLLIETHWFTILSSWLHPSNCNNISIYYSLSFSLSSILKLSFNSLHWNIVIFLLFS